MTQASRFMDDDALHALRAQFPILDQTVNGKPLVYLDNAATTQKPLAVLEAVQHYYRFDNANVHRGAHTLAERATIAFEAARHAVARHINADSSEQVIWTRGTTESINLVAQSWGRQALKPGDEIIVSAMEHHANIVPWQMTCQATGAIMRVIPVNEAGELDIDAYAAMLSPRTRLVAIVHVSNALGTVNPVQRLVSMAQQVGALTLVDGAQALPHWQVDVRAIGCDFYVFSGHKLYAPTGVGVLYGKRDILESMPPWQGGGEMISRVSFDGTVYNDLPYKFEAGTPHMEGVIGLGAAINWLESLNRGVLAAHEQALLEYATAEAAKIPGIRIVGTAAAKAGVLSFLLGRSHPHDVGTLLDQQGIAVRTGHHCAMPIMDRLGLPGTVRASFAFYNSRDDVDRLFVALRKAQTFLE